MLRLVKGKEDADQQVEKAPTEAQASKKELNPELSTAVGGLLTPYLGPVAYHVVRSAAASCSSLDELAESLSLRIPDTDERTAFLRAIASSGISDLPFDKNESQLEVAEPEVGDNVSAGQETASDELFTADQLRKLTQALAYYVGPLATRLVNAKKGEVNSMEELNLAVAKAISDPDDWAKFLMTRRNNP